MLYTDYNLEQYFARVPGSEEAANNLQTAIESHASLNKFNRGVVKMLRQAAHILNKAAATEKGVVGQMNRAAKLLNTKPKRKIAKKAIGAKNAVLVGLADKMFGSYEKNIVYTRTWTAEPEMVAMCLRDAADHLEIGCRMREGRRKAAYELFSGLDTSSRESTPEAVWSFLYDN